MRRERGDLSPYLRHLMSVNVERQPQFPDGPLTPAELLTWWLSGAAGLLVVVVLIAGAWL